MIQYTRSRRPGGTYFFTARTAREGSNVLLRDVDVLRGAMRLTRKRYPFEIEEIVVMGDVIHTIWTLPEGDTNYSKRWRMLRNLMARACPAPDVGYSTRLQSGKPGTWQRRFWACAIRDEADLNAHRHAMFAAPVQAGLVRRPTDWTHSSIHRAIKRGTYDADAHAVATRAPLQWRRTFEPYANTASAS